MPLDTANPFNKRIMFVFNIKTRLSRLSLLAYKVINYFDIIAQLMVFYMFITIFMIVIVF